MPAFPLPAHIPFLSSHTHTLSFLPSQTQALCQLLLGAVETSIALLQQAEGLARKEESPESVLGAGGENWAAWAYSFVAQNSAAGSDGLLPGLVLFAEKWFREVRRKSR
jgi:hypothetical protein